MNTITTPGARPSMGAATTASRLQRLLMWAGGWLERIPYSFIAFIARFSMAAVFWNSGQTKVQGFGLNFVTGEWALGWPRLSDSALALFRDEYKLPFIAPEWAAPMAAAAEHVLPVMLLLGLGTRFAALGLLGMTLVIQLLVYPGAYATHGTWAAVLLMLMARGAGWLSADHWMAARALALRSASTTPGEAFRPSPQPGPR